MAMFRSSARLALRRSAPASAASRFRSNGTADLTLRWLAPAATASRSSIGGCGSARSIIHTEQHQVEKSIQKSKQRFLNLYLSAPTDNNRELSVKSVEEELDYIRHLQDKAARARCAAKSLSEIESKERYFHFLDTVVAPTSALLMFVYWMWTIGST